MLFKVVEEVEGLWTLSALKFVSNVGSSVRRLQNRRYLFSAVQTLSRRRFIVGDFDVFLTEVFVFRLRRVLRQRNPPAERQRAQPIALAVRFATFVSEKDFGVVKEALTLATDVAQFVAIQSAVMSTTQMRRQFRPVLT